MEKFTTHITFTSGSTATEKPIGIDGISGTITRLCDGPAAAMGIIKRAIIVDRSDCIVLEIVGRDIVFPPQLAEQQRLYREAQKNQK